MYEDARVWHLRKPQVLLSRCDRAACHQWSARKVWDARGDRLFPRRLHAERKRASKAARRQSVDLERKLAAAERDLKRAIDGMIRGTISETEADQVIPELRRQRDRVKAALASAAKPPKVVELIRRRSTSTCGRSKG